LELIICRSLHEHINSNDEQGWVLVTGWMEIEDKLKELEQRLGTIEAQGGNESNQSQQLHQYQSQILPKLMLIREKMIAEGGDIDQVKNERDQAINENVALKKEIERLNYRVNHLVKSLNEEEAKNSKTA
jgi:hypothetical protein